MNGNKFRFHLSTLVVFIVVVSFFLFLNTNCSKYAFLSRVSSNMNIDSIYGWPAICLFEWEGSSEKRWHWYTGNLLVNIFVALIAIVSFTVLSEMYQRSKDRL